MYLEDILARHRDVASRDDRKTSDLVEVALRSDVSRGFAKKIVQDSVDCLAVIAEIKRRSPSRGALNQDLKPEVIASQYQQAGASCISVLTDSEFFGGSAVDLQLARNASVLPFLRKDFTVSLNDICDARIMNADCILLIVAALSRAELSEFHLFAKDLGLDVLVEVHDEAELEAALNIGAEIVGVNQRDLKTFEVDEQRAVRVANKIPRDILKIAESGVKTKSDALQLRQVGFHAILVGESLVTSDNIVNKLKELRV